MATIGTGIQQRIGETRDQIGGTRTGCRNANAHLARHSGVAIGRQCRSLFVTTENVAEWRVCQGVVYRQDRTSRIAKYDGYPLFNQRLQHTCAPVAQVPQTTGGFRIHFALSAERPFWSQPRRTQTLPHLFDGVSEVRIHQSVVNRSSGLIFCNPFSSKLTGLNLGQDFGHACFGTRVHYPRATSQITKTSGLTHIAMHSFKTALVKQIDDEFEFM